MNWELNFTDRQKVNWVRILALVSTLVMMIYAPNLWHTAKDFPVIPLFDWIPIPTGVFDSLFWWLFFGTQFLYIFINKRWLGWTVVLLYLYLALVDQNRLQPYFYQAFLSILAIVIFPKKTDTKRVLYAVVLIFVATYFWSGIQKANEEFYVQWLSALNKHFSFLPQWFLQSFTYAVPWLEALMGVTLLFNKTRKFAVLFILSMHSIIVFLLVYLDYPYNVIPWNIQNMISLVILFWGLTTYSPFEFFFAQFDKQRVLILFFTFLLPLSNSLFGFYDHLLSFHFFTAGLKYYKVEIGVELEDKLPVHIQEIYRYNNGTPYVIVNEWAGYVNKVLFYPEERCIKHLETYLRSFAENPNAPDLLKLQRSKY